MKTQIYFHLVPIPNMDANAVQILEYTFDDADKIIRQRYLSETGWREYQGVQIIMPPIVSNHGRGSKIAEWIDDE